MAIPSPTTPIASAVTRSATVTCRFALARVVGDGMAMVHSFWEGFGAGCESWVSSGEPLAVET